MTTEDYADMLRGRNEAPLRPCRIANDLFTNA